MLKMRLALVCGLLLVVCLFYQTTSAEQAGKPEPTAEGEPSSEPTGEPTDEDAKGSGKPAAKSEKQGGGGGGASAPGSISIPAIIVLVSVAKFIL